jgi:hypothetical protein
MSGPGRNENVHGVLHVRTSPRHRRDSRRWRRSMRLSAFGACAAPTILTAVLAPDRPGICPAPTLDLRSTTICTMAHAAAQRPLKRCLGLAKVPCRLQRLTLDRALQGRSQHHPRQVSRRLPRMVRPPPHTSILEHPLSTSSAGSPATATARRSTRATTAGCTGATSPRAGRTGGSTPTSGRT